MTAHPAPVDPVNPTDASAETRGLTPKARQALEGLPPALAALGHVAVGAALILAGTGAMLAAAVVLALASAPHRGAAAKQGILPLLAVSCTIAALLG